MREQRRPPVSHEAIEGMLTSRQSKWTLVVVLHLRRDTMRFSELQRDIGTISQKALTQSLRALERDGFVSRTSYATIPPRVDYALTELGHEALKAFEAFEAFATRHWHSVLAARALFDARDADSVELQLLRTADAR
jgi:DNA-binding HxlR family transcriptional regulator